jgi:hypothetical protein
MNSSATLTIPSHLYEQAQRIARSQNREVGDVVREVLEQGLSPLEVQTTSPEREREKEAFRRLHPDLVQQYTGEYVAIHGGKLIDHDADKVALLKRIDRLYRDKFVLIRPVQQEPEIVYEHRGVRY